jgi:hypothetical protein
MAQSDGNSITDGRTSSVRTEPKKADRQTKQTETKTQKTWLHLKELNKRDRWQYNSMEISMDGRISSVRTEPKKADTSKQTDRNTENLGGNTSEGIGNSIRSTSQGGLS